MMIDGLKRLDGARDSTGLDNTDQCPVQTDTRLEEARICRDLTGTLCGDDCFIGIETVYKEGLDGLV